MDDRQPLEGGNMTRETKIGLLVGLAFIIVIGILLSDHLTSSTEPPHANLINAGNNAMRGVGSPGTVANTPPTVVAPEIVPSQIRTVEEVNARQPQVDVEVGGGRGVPNYVAPFNNGNTAQPPIVIDGGNGPVDQPAPQGPIVMERRGIPPMNASAHEPVPTTITPQPPVINDLGLGETAKKFGEELVDASGKGIKKPAPGKSQEYTAEPGDSLSKMAAKFYGTSTKTSRDAIIAANPALKDNVDKVIVGKTYVIPQLANVAPQSPAVVPAPLPTNTPTTPAVGPVVKDAPTKDAPAAGEYFYTVSEGDNLYRIATDQLGKASAVAAIKELNKDVLKGEDTLHVGMRLRLPGKPVAKVN